MSIQLSYDSLGNDGLRERVDGLEWLRAAVEVFAEAICPACGWHGDLTDESWCQQCGQAETLEPCDYAKALAALPTGEPASTWADFSPVKITIKGESNG